MNKRKRRSGWWHIEGRIAGKRLRLALRTRNSSSADRTLREIQLALDEGPESKLWPAIKATLPANSFAQLASIVGFTEKVAEHRHTWSELSSQFQSYAVALVARGKMRDSTWARYAQTIRQFNIFLRTEEIQTLDAITKPVMEKYKSWRVASICTRKQSRGGSGLALDVAILHRVFAYAVENDLLLKNPVKMEGRPGDIQERGAMPYSADELSRMRQSAGEDFTAFILLLRSGMRGSDIVGLRWEEIDWAGNEINRVTQKRVKRVIIPLSTELRFCLDAEFEKRKPLPEDRVLLNPATGRPLTRPRLYSRIQALGRRANVVHAHPHRFRDTFAVDLLLRGASPFDVAKLLGDTVDTVEKHYAPFTRELRDRVRKIMDNGQGLENLGTIWAQTPTKTGQVQ